MPWGHMKGVWYLSWEKYNEKCLMFKCIFSAAYLFPSSLSPEVLEGLLGSGMEEHNTRELETEGLDF